MADAALREAEEEAGISPDTVDVLGAMDPLYIPVSKFEVTPVIGYWRQPGQVQVMDQRESYS
ncbi:NUDIX domain-containing protein, partial [Klebsiella pneumoniae]|nr:NUDIX domain-containing protein [Klebsiella pneumoniae]